MYRVEKSTAERRVDSREAKTWKSRVSVTIRRFRSRFGSLRLAVPLASPADNARIWRKRAWSTVHGVGVVRHEPAMQLRRRRNDCEVTKTEFVAFSFLVPLINHCAGSVRSAGGSIYFATSGSGRATDAGTAAATGGADPRRRHVSRPDCGSRPLAAATYRS